MSFGGNCAECLDDGFLKFLSLSLLDDKYGRKFLFYYYYFINLSLLIEKICTIRYDILLNKSCGVIYSGEKFFFIIEKYIFLFDI